MNPYGIITIKLSNQDIKFTVATKEEYDRTKQDLTNIRLSSDINGTMSQSCSATNGDEVIFDIPVHLIKQAIIEYRIFNKE